MSVYCPVIKKEEIKKGLLIIDKYPASHYILGPGRGPGIVSFIDEEKKEYKIFFFKEVVETGLLDLNQDYYYGVITSAQEVIDFFNKKLSLQRELTKEAEDRFFVEKRKLLNAEELCRVVPDMLKKYL